MASKKKQGDSFFSDSERFMPVSDPLTGEPVPPMNTDTGEFVNKGGRPKSRGQVKRASLFLDADLSFAVKMQAAMEEKSVSVLVSEIVRAYLTEKGTLEKVKALTEE